MDTSFARPLETRGLSFELRSKRVAHKLLQQYMPDDPEFAQTITEARESWKKDHQNPDGLLDFFEGNLEQEMANAEHKASLLYLAYWADQHHKRVVDLTPEEVREAQAAYPTKEFLEERENRAIQKYHDAEEAGLRYNYQSLHEYMIPAQQIDVEYRAALRLPDPIERDRTLRHLNDQYRAALEHVRVTENMKGNRAEYELIWLIRSWARETNLDHLVQISHALPQEDHQRKFDWTLTIGDQTFDIQAANFTFSSDTEDVQHDLLQKKAKRTPAHLLFSVFDADKVVRAFEAEDETRRRDVRNRRDIVDRLIGPAVPEEYAALFKRIAENPTKERKRASPLRASLLNKLVSTATLKEFGLLTPKEASDSEIVRQKKEAFIKASQEVFDSLEDARKPTEKLKRDMRAAMDEMAA